MNLKTKKKKRKDHHTGEKRTKFQYQCIDGNWTYYPLAYCEYYDGVLTRGLMHTHRCRNRNCRRLHDETFE
jgi:hypothetical protein